MKTYNIKSIECVLGENANDNWKIFSQTKPTDILFHLSSFPSCYVILKNSENIYPHNEIIEKAALICKSNTKYRNIKNIRVDYTFCANVIKGEKVGQIIYISNKKVLNIKV
jgi:predicted ribosome quality control (RQC) complex YloA/Tae2 family protein